MTRKGPWEEIVVPSSFHFYENGGLNEGWSFSQDICDIYFVTSSERFVLIKCSYDKLLTRNLASTQQSMLFSSHQAVTCPCVNIDRGEYPNFNEPFCRASLSAVQQYCEQCQ